jgi:hypothetical protein
VRPVDIGFLYRKLAGMLDLKISVGFKSSHFGNLKLMRKNGMEEIIDTFDYFPNLGIFTSDNAFSFANRITGLMEIRDHKPKAFALMKNMTLQVEAYFSNIFISHPNTKIWYLVCQMKYMGLVVQTDFTKVMSWPLGATS